MAEKTGDFGEQLLLDGQQLREQAKTFEALDCLNRAMLAFAAEHDYGRFAHALLDRAICWQHLHQFNENDFGYAVFYKKDAEAMLEILEAKNIEAERDQAYFMNAKASALFNNYAKAIELFKKAIEKMPLERAAQKGDWRTNLGKALYLNGEKDAGIQEILGGIEQVRKFSHEVDEHTFNVWVSGGYLRLAELLRSDNPPKSAGYLAQAKKIVDSDQTQAVRKKQIENFEKNGATGL